MNKLLKQAYPTQEGIHACNYDFFLQKRHNCLLTHHFWLHLLNLPSGIRVKVSRTQKRHLLQEIQDCRALQLLLILQHAFFNTVASLKF